MDSEKLVTVAYIYFEVKYQVILKDNPEVWCLNMKYFSRYKAKSLDCEIYVTVTHIYFEVKQLLIRKYGVHT